MSNNPEIIPLTEDVLCRFDLPDAFVQTLRERGLIAPEPVDALLIEARKVIAEHLDTIEDAQAVLAGENDNWQTMKIALAALRRGMELGRSKPELTLKEFQNLFFDVIGLGKIRTEDINRLHAALQGQSK